MKITFAYVGIRVKDMTESVHFYTKVLGTKEVGRSRIAVANGDAVNLVSEDGGFNLELNSYDKGSKYDTEYAIGGVGPSRLPNRESRQVPRRSEGDGLSCGGRNEDGQEPLGVHRGPRRYLDRALLDADVEEYVDDGAEDVERDRGAEHYPCHLQEVPGEWFS